ncbi:MAG: aminotransferase class V-fold PLP-dependent enzyme, partial [Alphaproteobacteria bacterium]
PRLPNTTALALPGVAAETQVIALDLAGIAVSAGSACSSGKVAASPVLAAMGAGRLAGQTVRISLGPTTSEAAVDHFLAAWIRLAADAAGPAVQVA